MSRVRISGLHIQFPSCPFPQDNLSLYLTHLDNLNYYPSQSILDSMLSNTLLVLIGVLAQSALGDSKLETHIDSLELVSDFSPVVLSEFLNYPRHHRTPFAVSTFYCEAGHMLTAIEVSPNGQNGYVAYLEGTSSVHVQKISLETFQKDGNVVSIDGAMEGTYLDLEGNVRTKNAQPVASWLTMTALPFSPMSI